MTQCTFHVVTLFPEMFDGYVNESILARAQKRKKIKINFYNPRSYTTDKHHVTDDRPYGGGPGMVMKAEPILKAVTHVLRKVKHRKVKTIILSPNGKQFTNTYAQTLSHRYTDIIIICGRYEGIDARVKKALGAEEVSVGPYILTGGELPAMILVDTIARQVDGVLGNTNSLEDSRIAGSEMYTRPECIVYQKKRYTVPQVLLSGDHQKILTWKGKKVQKRK